MDADPPPAKRRRTSPRLAGRGSTEPTPNASNKNNKSSTAPTTTPPDPPPPPPDDSDVTRPRPPSFASPTRASLARHNPAILERRQSLPPQNEGADDEGDDNDVEAMLDEQLGQSSAEKGKEREEPIRPLAQPAIRSPVRSPARSSPTRPLTQPALRSPVRISRSPSRSPTRLLFGGNGTGSGNGNPERGGSTLFTAPPQHSPQAARSHLLGSIAGSVAGSLLGEPPRRSPMKPAPRPLPPPDPQRSEDLLEPLIARDKRLSGLDPFRVHEEPPPEPELPPTPENVDPAALTTSPPGIHHSSTPSKRPRRLRGGGGGVSKPGAVQSSSPLKQPPLKPPPTITSATDNGGRKGDIGNADALKEASSNVPRRGRGRPRKSSAARNIQPFDPDADQKRERDAIQAEIAELEADLALAAAENARIRYDIEHGEDSNSGGGVNHRKDIISLLRRRVLPVDDDEEDNGAAAQSTIDWLQAATNPIAFLPFGKPRAVAELFQFTAPSSDNSNTDRSPPPPPPVSHHPIAMTAAEELPFLQAFTPLAFHSQIVLLPGSGAESSDAPPPLQQHIITASSNAPPGVFLARIEMTVHTRSLRIADLQVPCIDPPAAAAELQPLLERITGGSTGGSSALARNVTVLTWAMGEWVRVAVRRAKFWATLARKLNDKEEGIADMVDHIRTLRTSEKKRKRRKGGNNAGEDDDDDDDNDDPGHKAISKVELLEHLGRTAMDVDIPSSSSPSSSSSIRVEWTIQFDWTGEARSQIGVLVGVPGKWRKADKRGRLTRLPKLFDGLVRDRGDPMAAVQTVVALLAGDDGA